MKQSVNHPADRHLDSMTDGKDASKSGTFFAVLGLTLLALALLYLNAVPDCRADQQNDSFEYLALARSLCDGEGYQSKHWMPGFPLLLTPLIGPSEANWVVLKLAMISLALLGVVLTLQLFRAMTPPSASVPLTLVLASTPLFFDYAHRVMSEIPALASTMGVLVAMVRVKSSVVLKDRLLWGMALALMSVAAVLIRGNALALAPALLVGAVSARGSSATQTRWIMVHALTWLLLAYGLWTLRSESRQYAGIHNVTYAQEVQAKDIGALWGASGEFGNGVERVDALGFGQRIYKNLCWYQIYRIAGLFVPSAGGLAEVEYSGIGLVIAAILVIPQIFGFIRLSARSPELATFLLFSMILIVVYPTGNAARMLLPFLPILILTGYLGFEWMIGIPLVGGWLICLLASNLVLCAVAADEQRRQPYSREGFADFVNVITAELPRLNQQGERVGSYLETEFYAILGHRPQSIRSVHAAIDAGQLDSALIIHKGDYSPGPNMEASVLVRRGRVELLRIKRM